MADGAWGALAAGVAATGGLINAGVSQAFSAHNMLKQYKYAKQLQQQNAQLSYKYTKKLNKYNQTHTYQNTVYDLKKAGINPMLAYMQGGTPASGSVSAVGL